MLLVVTRVGLFNKLFSSSVTSTVCKGLSCKLRSQCHSFIRGYNVYLSKCLINNNFMHLSSIVNYSSSDSTESSEQELTTIQFEKISNETLESLTEYFDQLIEQAAHLSDGDVSFGDGVLTVKFGDPYGTYVINRQTPNKQIWLSSPKSGPKRYDLVNGKWVYKHDGKSMHDLLNDEIPSIVKTETCFDKCSFSGKDTYAAVDKIVKMEIMEDGSLVDRVRILLQRDMQYYQEMQTVLKESLCIRVSGGKLDFPRHASFAAVKIVSWWEADFKAAFKRASGLSSSETENTAIVEGEERVVKKIQPSEFILLVVDTAEQLLEHLHTLIQESLDHADLTVLTATLGAAALVRNCLWCYNQHTKGQISRQASDKINKSYKSYHEIAEAVAERLLDLHCRLISLYILNEADSLSWHTDKPFFEKERCSFVIQMWWLYMQGTKVDLWSTVPPKMAQRVFSGMLNESLSIIVTRFVHGRPTLARSEQFWTDAFNALCCTGYLALDACINGDEMLGTRFDKLPTTVRDIHAKCNELLICLLLRGTPLKDLYQAFRNGLENLPISRPRCGPAPWLLICAPSLLGTLDSDVNVINLSEDRAVILELNVLRHQPQPNWPHLMKVISMNDYAMAKLLLRNLVRQCIGLTNEEDDEIEKSEGKENSCNGFLCSGFPCDKSLKISYSLALHSLMHILAVTAREPETVIVPALKQDPNWYKYLGRQQVWNQSRPPWLNALLRPLKGMMQPIVEILLEGVKTGASMYQAMSLALGCFAELYLIAPVSILRTAFALNENIPANCHPIGGNVLLQILCASLYSSLLETSKKFDGETSVISDSSMCESYSFNPHDRSATAIALAEAICSIDEDNKHTAQIESFVTHVRESIRVNDSKNNEMEKLPGIIETYADDLLLTGTGRLSLKIIHEYLVRASDWILKNLRNPGNGHEANLINLPAIPPTAKPLTHIMFHIEDSNFDQFLINYEGTKWKRILTMPLSVNVDRIRSQLLLRPEFKNLGDLSQEERDVATSIRRLCFSVKSAHFT